MENKELFRKNILSLQLFVTGCSYFILVTCIGEMIIIGYKFHNKEEEDRTSREANRIIAKTLLQFPFVECRKEKKNEYIYIIFTPKEKENEQKNKKE